MICYFKDGFIADSVGIGLSSPFFKYGLGFFETLFYNGRRIMYLEEHLKRLYSSLDTYLVPYEREDVGTLAGKVIRMNSLEGRTARINVYYPAALPGENARVLISAAPYDAKPDKSYSLEISALVHLSHLCAHKSMNYAHFHLSWAQAAGNGFDDALLTDGRGGVLETTKASLLFRRGEDEFVSPGGGMKLPGIALDIAGRMLPVRDESVSVSELAEFERVYVLNSLMGMKPVVRIDRMEFEPDWETCNPVSEVILYANGK